MTRSAGVRTMVAAAWAVARRPTLWSTAIVQVRQFAPDGWWRRWPFLPVPDPKLVAFRATTQYGESDHPIEPTDVITWLLWCRSERRRRHG